MERPILFNTEMVRAILDGRKTQTRRVCKGQPQDGITPPGMMGYKPPFHAGDILWVRETWCRWWMPHGEWHYCYKASDPNGNKRPTGPEYDDGLETRPWRPSIHMPKEAARLFLRVTDVRIERLQDISRDGAIGEGCNAAIPVLEFKRIWNSTIMPAVISCYGWEANPWVWVIEFKRIEKEEVERWD